MRAPDAMPSDRRQKTRVRIAFFCLFISLIVISFGAYCLGNLDRLRGSIAAREDQTALRGITDPDQIDEALRRHPANKLLQLIAMATRAANATNAAVDALSNEVEPPGVARNINLGAASRGDIEALRRDLKAAEANATTLLPRHLAIFKTERDNVEKYALSLRVDKDTVHRLLDSIDKRHAEITAFISRMLSARAGFYRAYESYVAVLAAEFGNYKVVNGQFIFPFQRTVDRYNVAAQAMTVAAKHVAELEADRKGLEQARQERWQQFVNGE